MVYLNPIKCAPKDNIFTKRFCLELPWKNVYISVAKLYNYGLKVPAQFWDHPLPSNHANQCQDQCQKIC